MLHGHVNPFQRRWMAVNRRFCYAAQTTLRWVKTVFFATTIPTESSLCVVSLCLRTLVPCGGVEEQLLRERDIFSTIGWALWFRRARPAECACSFVARGQKHCGDRCHCVGAHAGESSVASGLAGVLMSILRNQVSGSTRACQVFGVSEAAAGEYLSALARHLSTYSVSTFRAAVSSWKHRSLWAASSSTSWAVHRAPAASVRAFLESVPMGGSSFQKNAVCPCAAMSVLGGLPCPLCCNWNWTLAFCVSRTFCLW